MPTPTSGGFDYWELLDKARDAARDVHLTDEQYKALKKQLKLKKDEQARLERETQVKEHEAAINAALQIYRAKHPEAVQTVRQQIEYITPKDVDVDMSYSGIPPRGTGQSDTALRADLGRITDDKKNIKDGASGLNLDDGTKQFIQSTFGKIDAAVNAGATAQQIYDMVETARSELVRRAAQNADNLDIYIKTGDTDLSTYGRLAVREIECLTGLNIYPYSVESRYPAGAAQPPAQPQPTPPSTQIRTTPPTQQEINNVLDIWESDIPDTEKWTKLAETGLQTQTILSIIQTGRR